MNSNVSLLRRVWRKARRKVAKRTDSPVDPFAKYTHVSYAQEGEDILLMRVFPLKSPGFYVDVGAYRPVVYSTTYTFYKNGWHGINIDAMPGSMAEFRRLRPNDINLEIAIANHRGTATYHMYRGQELNTLNRQWVDERPQDESYYNVVKTVEVETYPLVEILDKHMPPGKTIDFMNVDVEGVELEVVASNDWERYRPRVVLLEQAGKHSLDALRDDPATQYMASIEYTVFAKTFNTVFYVACEQLFDWFR